MARSLGQISCLIVENMDNINKYDIPWDLISGEIQDNLSLEEAVQLKHWLNLSSANQEKYDRVHQTWKTGIADYNLYLKADEESGWNSLRDQLGFRGEKEEAVKVIPGHFGNKFRMVKRWAAAAAVLIISLAGFYWYNNSVTNIVAYQTTDREQLKISLKDGSTIFLKPQSEVLIARDYNKLNRTVQLTRGEAFFEVQHEQEKPFIVNIDIARVEDIGTSFTIQKREDSINVTVSTGRVSFVKKATNETHELSAGMSLSLNVLNNGFGEIISPDSVNNVKLILMQFDNTTLVEVIDLIEKKYNRKIKLNDDVIAKKRFTAKLDGQNFDSVIKIICASLHLVYFQKDGVYILKEKDERAQ